jgi:uncharacterized protein YuzE
MYFMGDERRKMHVLYREGGRIIGIEILDGSKHVTLDRLLPVRYEVSRGAV